MEDKRRWALRWNQRWTKMGPFQDGRHKWRLRTWQKPEPERNGKKWKGAENPGKQGGEGWEFPTHGRQEPSTFICYLMLKRGWLHVARVTPHIPGTAAVTRELSQPECGALRGYAIRESCCLVEATRRRLNSEAPIYGAPSMIGAFHISPDPYKYLAR